mgnify:CR=1 FL=1
MSTTTVMQERDIKQRTFMQNVFKALGKTGTYAFLLIMALIILFPFYWMINSSLKTLDEYKKDYGSDAYGLTAYILNLVRLYSIPFCFLGIAVSAIYQYVIGIRKLDTQEKGLHMMVAFITILVICQILPLAFAIVVKFGRG